MAQSYQSATFGTLTIPQAVASYNVQTSNSGLAANGIVMVVGEADAGPDYTLETDLNKNSFGPNSVGDVIAKYQSGPIVDAVSAWSSPADDPNIPGAPTAFIIAKTNPSKQAVGTLLGFNDTTYATIGALLLGAGGNNTTYQVEEAEAEIPPSTGAFTILVPIGTVSLAVRVNGGVKQTATIATNTLPSGVAAALAGITGINVTGGTQNAILTAGNDGNTLGLAAAGNIVTFTLTGGVLGAALTAGDTLYISTTSDVSTATGNATLAGSYVVISGAVAGGTSFVAQKLQDASGTPGTLTAVSIGTSSVTLTTAATDVEDFSPLDISLPSATTTVSALSNGVTLPVSVLNVVSTTGFPSSGTLKVASSTGIQTLTYTGTTPTTFTGVSGGTGTLTTGGTVAVPGAEPLNGLGKSLEIAELTAGTLVSIAYALSPTPVIWVSTATSPTGITDGAPLVSSQELEISLVDQNVVSNTQETLTTVGGEIGLEVGYAGTTAQVVVGTSSLVFTWTGGPNLTPGSTITLTFKNYPTIASIVEFLNTQLGFTAAPGNGLLGFLPSTALDEGTFAIGSTFGTPTGRIKVDAYRFVTRTLAGSSYIGLVGAAPTSGLPVPTVNAASLAGGTRGFTTNANVTGALDALQNVVGNFTVTCFSQDASKDILIGETDPGSTYTIALINAYSKTNALLCSQPKRKKSRQSFLSINDTFVNDQDAASSIASFRSSMTFQSVQNTSTSAQAIVLFQPWMLAGLAASMQAAAGYKGIVNKYINCDSIIQAGSGATADYNDQNDDQETTALLAGLLPAKRDLNAGGVFFVSDQTTYGADSNFVFNSIQAIYVADTMALTLAMRMQRAFVGQSLADISAAQAVSTVQNILADFLTLKLIAPSDGAPKGYQPGSIVCKISGTVMTVNLTVYLAGLLYFVPIVFQINQVQQTASA
jgi:hypothetical protein